MPRLNAGSRHITLNGRPVGDGAQQSNARDSQAWLLRNDTGASCVRCSTEFTRFRGLPSFLNEDGPARQQGATCGTGTACREADELTPRRCYYNPKSKAHRLNFVQCT